MTNNQLKTIWTTTKILIEGNAVQHPTPYFHSPEEPIFPATIRRSIVWYLEIILRTLCIKIKEISVEYWPFLKFGLDILLTSPKRIFSSIDDPCQLMIRL